MFGNQLVEALAVGGDDILYIVGILQSAFNLERDGTCLSQCLQMVNLAEVLQREQMPLVLNLFSIGIDQVELHSAELRAGSAVGTPTETMFRGITLTAIAHAEGTVDEYLQFYLGFRRMNGLYFL